MLKHIDLPHCIIHCVVFHYMTIYRSLLSQPPIDIHLGYLQIFCYCKKFLMNFLEHISFVDSECFSRVALRSRIAKSQGISFKFL